MAALAVLLLSAVQAACTTGIDDRPDLHAALERYRLEFVKMHPGDVLPVSDPDYQLLAGTMRLVLAAYVDPTNPQLLIDRALEGLWERKESDPAASRHALTESAIDRMLAGLDPYSSFLDAEHVNDLREQIHGEFAGLGIDVAMDDRTGFLRVLRSSTNSPAARAGMRSGDLIVTIDGQQVRGLTLNDAATRIRGQAGGAVDLTVLRPDSRVPVRVSVLRTVLKVRPVVHRLEGDIGYVSIAYFSEQTSQDLADAMESMRLQAGGRLAGAVLDLRNNPGGLLDQGVKVAGRFLGPAEVVSTRGRNAATQHYYSSDSTELLRSVPLVVLINGFSSSAAEIVAGALQDHRRALLMGARSYGKGSVQTIFWLPGGEGIRLTTAHYFRPSGALVECYGISPNVEIYPSSVMRASANGAMAGVILPDREACEPAGTPPLPRTWPAAELCPDVSRMASDAASTVKRDFPADCAFAAIRTRRLETVMR